MSASPRTAARRLLLALFAVLSGAASVGAATPHARDPRPGEARVRAKIVDHRVLIRCQLSSHAAAMPAYLFLAYDRLCGIELHNQATNALEIEKNGRRRPFKVGLSRDLEIDVEAREHGDEQELGDFTKLHSAALEEIGVLGSIGANVLKDYQITFDLPNGFVYIAPPRAEAFGKPAGPEASYVRAYATSKLVWLPVRFDGKHDRVVGIGGSRFDSVVDEMICEEAGVAGGRIPSVEVGGLDLSKLVAWRPEELEFAHEAGALGVLGLDFLQDFRVEIDRVNSWVGLTRIRKRPYPEAAAQFFDARAEEESAPLHTWLESNSEHRLAGLAADALLNLLVDEDAGAKALEDAIRWVDRTRPAPLRATRALDTMALLSQAKLPEAAVVAGRLGVEAGRLDRYPESVHRLHVRLGELLLGLRRDREAWEHLMSAAFGLAEAIGAADQAKVNLLLGRYYERVGRYRRAASRYVQALITPEAGEAAIAGLSGIQKQLGDERFDYEFVEKRISGKVRGMVAPDRFEPDEETRGTRVVLVEHLSNPHVGQKRGETWRAFTEGAAMAFQGILTHFPRERVAMVSYQGSWPRPVGITNELSQRASERLGGRPVFAIDGKRGIGGAFEHHQADQGYKALRRGIKARLGVDAPCLIEGKARVRADGHVVGQLEVTRAKGADASDARVEVLLVEEGVLYPGLGAVVVHRMVARAPLTESIEGALFAAAKSSIKIDFDRALAAIESENRRFLAAHERETSRIATRLSVEIDPEKLAVLVIVRDPANGRVLQSAHVAAPREGESR